MARTSGPQARTSGLSRATGHPAQLPEIWRPITEAGPCQPGHPAPTPGHPASREGPDIRPVARTSGPLCLRAAHLGRGPCTPSSLRLYILPHLLLVRVSKGLAHLEIELCSSISDLLHERDRGPSTETIHLGFKTSSRRRPPSRPPHGEEPVTLCIVRC